MDSGFPLTEIDGIDLSNYIRDPNSHNPVVYIHKRTLKRSTLSVDEQQQKTPKVRHTGQQFDHAEVFKDTCKINVFKNDRAPLMEHTIQFAKDIIPISIPPNNDDDDVYYTIKSMKKSRADHRSCNVNFPKNKQSNASCKTLKDKTKKLRTKFKKNFSATETVSQSSQNTNTIDDINTQTLSELSDVSEHSKPKEDTSVYKKETNKLIPSESFEAIAEQYFNAGNIKVHIMNDKEKNVLCENIRVPLVKAIEDSVSKYCTKEIAKEINSVKAKLDSFSKKFDIILERLIKIEKKLDSEVPEHEIPLEKVWAKKPSRLEELGEDIGAINANLSSDGDSRTSKRRQEKTEHITVQNIDDEIYPGDVSGSLKDSSPYVVKKPTISNRTPARFSWTDVK